eukprot:jgi/Ulvmu1/4608/UM002_0337.1
MIGRTPVHRSRHGLTSGTHSLLWGNRNGSTLVIADAAHGSLKQSFWACVTAAAQLNGRVHALVCGHDVATAAQDASRVSNVQNVLKADHTALQHHLAEPMASLICKVMQRRKYDSCIMPASTAGKNILPRAAALLRTQPITDVTSILSETTFMRPIYAGNAIATVERTVSDTPLLMTIRPTSFDSAAQASEGVPIEDIHDEEYDAMQEEVKKGLSLWIASEERQTDRPDLSSAPVVVSGGRALKSADNFKMIEELADVLGGAVGASRAAVDAGMVANDLQVGQTGKVVAPELYIAIGISGAIQHVAGIKDSNVIAAINSDAEAPIFSIADIGLVGDLFEIIPQLTDEIRKRKAASPKN